MSDAMLLARALCDPAMVGSLDARGWTALIAMARAEQMIGTLAARLRGQAMPVAAARILADAGASAAQQRIAALWEAEMARRVLAVVGCPIVLLKGTAFAASGLTAGEGRSIGDLDILVPRSAIDAVERALLGAGWEWVKPDPYDDAYYRRWMHELPPLIHRDRDRMIDVHHTILPLTARITPDAGALIADSVVLADGLRMLAPNDMIVHAAAHLLADGDLAGGMRNLWDIHCLIGQFGLEGLADRADEQVRGLDVAVHHAVLVHVVQGLAELRAQLQDAGQGQVLALDGVFEHRVPAVARLVLHDEVVAIALHARIEAGHDVGVLEAHVDLGLALEARDLLAHRQAGLVLDQHLLDGQHLLGAGRLGQVDLAGHGARDLVQDLVVADLLARSRLQAQLGEIAGSGQGRFTRAFLRHETRGPFVIWRSENDAR